MREDLKKLGLTENEIKIYLSLLKVGETPVGGVVNDLKWHRQLVYNALDSLEKRNMVIKIMKNKIYHFKIADPQIIVENLQKQKLIAERLSKNIATELKKSRHEHGINIYDGREKIHRFFIEKYKYLPIGTTIYILASLGKKFEKVLSEKFLIEKYDKLRIKRKIHSKNLSSEIFRNEFKEQEKVLNTTIRKVKFLPYNLKNPITAVIWLNSVSYQFFLDKPFIIEIKNKELRDSYLEHFNLLWKIAKK
ncbi:MAG: helix-turn-helix domain-containing protein [Patescibacteria group bacterium]|nr:helix-turn-helix domain-containing protein [Patescibacteria group bacterium]